MFPVVRRMEHMGDVLYTEPFIRALQGSLPSGSKVYVHTAYPDVFLNHPLVEIVGKNSPPNYVLDALYERCWKRGQFKYMTTCYLDHFGFEVEDLRPKIHLSESEMKWAEDKLGEGKWMVIDTGYFAIMNFETDSWNRLLRELKEIGWKILVIGKSEGWVANTQELEVDLDLRGRTNIRQLFALIHQADFFLGVESGPFVVAMSFNKKGILLSGITEPHMILLPDSNIVPVPCYDKPWTGLRTYKENRKRVLETLRFPENSVIINSISEVEGL